MSLKLTQRVQNLQSSVTLQISAKVSQLKAEGKPVIGFAAGEPDFVTPAHINAAAVKALEQGKTKYTPASGIPELRKALAEDINKSRGTEYKASNILVTFGAKYALFLAYLAHFEEGDEVLVPAPYWVSFPEALRFAGATPVSVPLAENDGYALNADVLLPYLTERTRGLILCSPSNPSGAVLSREDVASIGKLCKERGITVIADETYDRLVYPPAKHHSILEVTPEMREQTILVGSFSKTFAMTGWRVGFAAAPDGMIAAMGKIQGQSTSNVTSIAQWAAVEALTGDQAPIQAMFEAFYKRRNLALELLSAMPDVSFAKPDGAFYIFLNIGKYLSKDIPTALDFANKLLESKFVAVVPGEDFGSPQHIRLSYATSEENIREGFGKIAAFLSEIRG
jgi:aspartate aminotransferase